MRLVPVFVLWLLAAIGLGQTATDSSLFRTTRFEATVVVRKHNTGADLVEVTVLKPTYSAELLRRQVDRLAQELRSQPRGLQIVPYTIDPTDPTSKVLRASFAVDGLIDRTKGVLHLQPIARAFAVSQPPDALEVLMVQFERETPSGTSMLQACAPPAPGCENVIVEGRFVDAVYGIEYRMKLLTHDPDKISLPDVRQEAPAAKPAAPKPARTDWTLIVLLVVAALAVGALVYSLLSRGRPKARA